MRVDNEVMVVLGRAETLGNALTLTGKLDRNLYTKTNKVLEAAGGKWDRKSKAHIFADDASDRIGQIILTGEIDIPKDEFEFFPTPKDVVERLLELAEIFPGQKVLEPSAGRGAIAFACADAGGVVNCIELMEANYTFLASDNRLNSVRNMDFMAQAPEASYDRVVMNPPFSKQQDIKHVNHALKFLKPDGLLVSVMSASVIFRENALTKEFRDLVHSRNGLIEKLPEAAFKQSGTMVNTVIVMIPA